MLISTLSRFARRLANTTSRSRATRRSRSDQHRVTQPAVVAACVESLETREVLSALSLAHGALVGASDFLGTLEDSIKSVQSGVHDVPLLGDNVDSSLQSLSDDIHGVKVKIDNLAMSITTDALANDVQHLLYQALGLPGLNILGDSADVGTDVSQSDISVTITDGVDLPSIDVKFNLHRDLIDKTLAQGAFTAGVSSLPFRLDVGGSGGVKINVGFDYQNFHFMFDETNGFQFDDSVQNELTLYAKAGLTDDAHLNVTVGFLRAVVTDGAMVDGQLKTTGLSLIEPIDIKFDGGVPIHPQTPYLSADLDLHVDAGFSDETQGLNRNFPGFATDFVLHRQFGSAPAQNNAFAQQEAVSPHFVSTEGGNSPNQANAIQNVAQSDLLNPADVVDTVTAAFNNVQFHLGEFIGQVFKPIIKMMQDIDKPIKPLLDALRVNIPILSQIPFVNDLLNADGKDGVSLIDVARDVANLNVLDPDYDALLELILFFDNVRNFIDNIDTNGDINSLVIKLGDHSLMNTNPNGGSLLNLDGALKTLSANKTSFVDQFMNFDGPGSYHIDQLKEYVDQKLKVDVGIDPAIVDQLTAALDIANNGVNYHFPIFECPVNSIMQFLIGRDADIFTMDGQFDVPGTTPFTTPLGALPVVGFDVNLAVNAHFLSRFKLGYDSYGLRKSFSAPDPGAVALDLLEGNYIGNQTMIDVAADITIKAEKQLLIFDASVEGGVSGHVNVHIPQPAAADEVDSDPTKVRPNSELKDCLQEADGKITAHLGAEASVGIGPLKATKHFDLPEFTIIDFTACLKNPFYTPDPVLAGIDPAHPGVLQLFIGADAVKRNVEPLEQNESYNVAEFLDPADGKLTTIVSAFGISQTFKGVTKITGDGSTGNDNIVIDRSVHSDAVLKSGIGDDNLEYRGTGHATLMDGVGNDVLRGGSGARNVLLGQGGNDSLVGGGKDDSTMNIFGISVADGVTDDPGDDQMTGGKGHYVIHGGTGNDTLFAGPLNDSLFGDAGNDALQAGIGQSTLDGGFGNDNFAVQADSGSTMTIGSGDNDSVGIEGTDAIDTFTVGSSNNNIVVTQNTMDQDILVSRIITVSSTEGLLIDGKGSADNIAVNDLTNTRLQTLGLNLQDLLNLDHAQDHIVINGRSVADTITVSGEQVDLQKFGKLQGGITTVTGLPEYKIDIANVLDDVQIRTLGGNDTINLKGATGPTIIDGGIGDDHFNVFSSGFNDYLGLVTLKSGAGKSQLDFPKPQRPSRRASR